MSELKLLLILAKAGTGQVISADDPGELDALQLSLDKSTIAGFIERGGIVQIFPGT